MLRTFFSVVLLFIGLYAFPQSEWKHGRLKTSANGYYLQYEDGKPFFWLGDTGWELFHRLRREEIAQYLDNRQQKGFNVIQAVILAEFDGLRKPNQYGELPFRNTDPDQPNENYFKLVDWTIREAGKRNLFIGLLPTWGDKVTKMWGEGPVVFNEANAYTYGLFLGKRYASAPNIVWILGGDRPPVQDSNDWRPIWRAMAKGIKEGTKSKALITYHISGGEHSTSFDLHQEKWLDINMMQSGHGSGHDVPVWNWIARDRALLPHKPTLDSEPNYEDHPVNPWPKWDSANGYFRDYDVRKQCYRSVFAGACGVTYGHHSIWQFWNPREEKVNHADRYWTEAMDRPGAYQVGYLRMLMESRPMLTRIPDQSILLNARGEKENYSTAFRSADSSYLMVYSPTDKMLSVNTKCINATDLKILYFDPRTGETVKTFFYSNIGSIQAYPAENGKEKDWVLIIEDLSKKFKEPGKTK